MQIKAAVLYEPNTPLVCTPFPCLDRNVPGERVTRGGDHVFDVAPDQLTGYFRDGFSRNPRRGHRHIGFRCAKDAGNG